MLRCYFALLLFLLALPAAGRHIMGGEITYRYLDNNGPPSAPFRYELTFQIYVDMDGNPGSFPGGVLVEGIEYAVYDAANNQQLLKVNTPSPAEINEGLDRFEFDLPPGCSVPDIENLRVRINRIRDTVNLPFSAEGYHVLYNDCCRNLDVLNITHQQGNSFYTKIPSPLFPNSSPQFTDAAIPFICAGDTTTLVNTATDPDGDKLVYSFVTPLDMGTNSAPLNFTFPSFIDYASGFGVNNVFGSGGFQAINPSSGVTRYMAPNTGKYLVGVEVREFRELPGGGDTLIGVTRRELQIVAGNCPPNSNPDITANNISGPPGSGNTDVGPDPQDSDANNLVYNILAGQKVELNYGTSDPESNPLVISAEGDILEPGFSGPQAQFQVQNDSTPNASADFEWQTDCATEGSFTVLVDIEDLGCPPKVVNNAIVINVSPFRGPQEINGPDTICFPNDTAQYSLKTPVEGTHWRVENGQLFGSPDASSIKVLWNDQDINGKIVLRREHPTGCLDSTTFTVVNHKINRIQTRSDTTLCQGDSVQLNTTGTNPGIFTWQPAAGLSDPTVANPIARPDTSTTYRVRNIALNGCRTTDTVRVEVLPGILNGAGPDDSLCHGDSLRLGKAPENGKTYQWQPSTGLDQPNSARPWFRSSALPNQDSTLLFEVSITDTASGCVSRDTALLHIGKQPQPQPGNDTTICSGQTVTLGEDSAAGLSYLWTSSSGQDLGPSKTHARLQLFLINPTQTTLTNTYFLEVRDTANGCSRTDSVRVTVLPNLIEPAGPDTTVCHGAAVRLGKPQASGFSYQWKPAGLASPADTAEPLYRASNTSDTLRRDTLRLSATSPEGCNFSDEVVVAVRPRPQVAMASADSLCQGQPLALGSGNPDSLSYQWDATIGGFSDAGLAAPTYTVASRSAVTRLVELRVLATAPAGCTFRDTLVLTVPPSYPHPQPAGNDTALCEGASAQLGAAPEANHRYQWSPATGLSDPAAAAPKVTANPAALAAGSIAYSLTITNEATGCTTSDTVSVDFSAKPSALLPDSLLCSGQELRFQGSLIPELSVSFFPDSLFTRQGNEWVFLPKGNTSDTIRSFTVWKVVEDMNSACLGSDTATFRILPALRASAGPDTTLCQGETAPLGGNNPDSLSYSWQPASGLSDPAAPKPTVDPSQWAPGQDSMLYRLSMESPSGCQKTDSVLVRRPLISAATVAGPDTVCEGESGLRYRAQNVSSDSLSWEILGGSLAQRLSPGEIRVDWQGNEPSGTVVLFSYGPQGQCRKSDSLSVTFDNQLRPRISASEGLICGDGQDSLAVQILDFNPNSTYALEANEPVDHFFFNDSLIIIKSQTPTTNLQIQVRERRVGLPACQGLSNAVDVVVSQPPAAPQIVGPDTACGTATALYALANPSPVLSYTWAVSGGQIISGQGSDSLRVRWGDSTFVGEVSAFATNAAGCGGPEGSVATAVRFPVAPSLIAGDTLVCQDTLSPQSYALANPQARQMVWEVEGGQVLQQTALGSQVEIAWDTAQSPNRFRVWALDGATTCPGDTLRRAVTFDLGRPELTTASFPAGDEALANPNLFLNLALATQPDSLLIASADAQTAPLALQGSQAVSGNRVSVVPQSGKFWALGRKTACGDTLFSQRHRPLQLSAQQSGDTVRVAWQAYRGWDSIAHYRLWHKAGDDSFEPLADSLDTLGFRLSPEKRRKAFRHCFQVQAFSGAGVSAFSNAECVNLENPIKVFNVLTLNEEDAINNVFRIEHAKLYPQLRVEIYNRWGEQVFKETGYRNDWNGGDLPAGTYFYRVYEPQSGIDQTGHLFILR